jgi:hypothetical protein
MGLLYSIFDYEICAIFQILWIYTLCMVSILWYQRKRQLSRYVPVDAGFVGHKFSVLVDKIKGTLCTTDRW